MGKKNIKPQQQQPVIRYNTAKSIAGLTEENLTQGYANSHQAAIPLTEDIEWYDERGCGMCSFDGDDAE